ncbi:MAG: molybdenum ABC transporter ATP-binding protein [Acidobacteria bacterium]|nr:MAG: molybdenum ABC transporter ATP-binding protein [Acidobacteriota bacterium]
MAVEVVNASTPEVSQTDAQARTLVAHIRKSLSISGGDFLLELDFTAIPGITIIFGPSGAGKTTLLDCIAGLITPDEGRIQFGEQVFFHSAQRKNLPVRRRRVGYVFQDLALFPHLTVEQNIQYGLSGLAAKDRVDRSTRILESFRIGHLRDRRPREISGGERQRVALARSLVTDPCVLLLDEPLAGLDLPTKTKILDDLREWNKTHRIPILYVTHSRDEVFGLGERVLVLEAGRIVASGTPHQVMRAPRSETIAQLAGFENIFDAVVIGIHEDRGTMTCLLGGTQVQLETPLVRAEMGSKLRVAISAGDILLAAALPVAISAQNILPGVLKSLMQRDVIIAATIDCGVEAEAHLTLAARDSLHLQPGKQVWLIVKTHSCHLLAA